ncbi:unnamed protein product [Anisakis simplex]|uniref:MH2 domain-containing protein n=1 Tax=Anisakis simplex TaxID=6269 RepID=A0A0M3JWC1_ANISI|nr:unnamed protein product [Anisakis simplex]
MCDNSFALPTSPLPPDDSLLPNNGFSRTAVALGTLRVAVGNAFDDVWYDMERFQMDHISEVINKLDEGEIDDEIWGKIIIMERGRRIAKAYLRNTTIIVDGGEEEFDGQTLGFNHFENAFRDEHTSELRSKIGDGVIIKMDNQGNIKAMARGSTPIIVQGTAEPRLTCIPEKLIKQQGRLKTNHDQAIGGTDEERIAKIFDIRRFKSSIADEMNKPIPNRRELLLKSCVRIALVKDGGSDPMKTPCWFMIINLVALDMLKTKLPNALNFLSQEADRDLSGREPFSKMESLLSLLTTSAKKPLSQEALQELLKNAIQQANDPSHSTNRYARLSESTPVLSQIDQLAQLANTLRLRNNPSKIARNKRYSRRSRSCSDTDESLSSEEFSYRRARYRSALPTTTKTFSTTSSSGISTSNARLLQKGDQLSSLDNDKCNKATTAQGCSDEVPKNTTGKESSNIVKKENAEQQENQRNASMQSPTSCFSTTSDYDSNREVYDSASCYSFSAASSINFNTPEDRQDSSKRSHSSPQLSANEQAQSKLPSKRNCEARNDANPTAPATDSVTTSSFKTNTIDPPLQEIPKPSKAVRAEAATHPQLAQFCSDSLPPISPRSLTSHNDFNPLPSPLSTTIYEKSKSHSSNLFSKLLKQVQKHLKSPPAAASPTSLQSDIQNAQQNFDAFYRNKSKTFSNKHNRRSLPLPQYHAYDVADQMQTFYNSNETQLDSNTRAFCLMRGGQHQFPSNPSYTHQISGNKTNVTHTNDNTQIPDNSNSADRNEILKMEAHRRFSASLHNIHTPVQINTDHANHQNIKTSGITHAKSKSSDANYLMREQKKSREKPLIDSILSAINPNSKRHSQRPVSHSVNMTTAQPSGQNEFAERAPAIRRSSRTLYRPNASAYTVITANRPEQPAMPSAGCDINFNPCSFQTFSAKPPKHPNSQPTSSTFWKYRTLSAPNRHMQMAYDGDPRKCQRLNTHHHSGNAFEASEKSKHDFFHHTARTGHAEILDANTMVRRSMQRPRSSILPMVSEASDNFMDPRWQASGYQTFGDFSDGLKKRSVDAAGCLETEDEVLHVLMNSSDVEYRIAEGYGSETCQSS